jgi:hypothetical protein
MSKLGGDGEEEEEDRYQEEEDGRIMAYLEKA